MQGDPTLPRIIKVPKEMQATAEEIPVVKHRSTFGVVEITRGCGRGCQFCGPATKVGRSFPLEHILESARTNSREGATEIMISSEDMRSEEHTSELQSRLHLVCRLLLEKKKTPR